MLTGSVSVALGAPDRAGSLHGCVAAGAQKVLVNVAAQLARAAALLRAASLTRRTRRTYQRAGRRSAHPLIAEWRRSGALDAAATAVVDVVVLVDAAAIAATERAAGSRAFGIRRATRC